MSTFFGNVWLKVIVKKRIILLFCKPVLILPRGRLNSQTIKFFSISTISKKKICEKETFLARYRGTDVHSFEYVRASLFWPGTQIQRYKAWSYSICWHGTQIQRDRAWLLRTFLRIFMISKTICLDTKVHRYRARNLWETATFFGQIQRYWGTQL